MKNIFLILSLFALTGCDTLFKWQTEYPDNFVEERVEDFIKDKTGADIDLTPLTGDEKQIDLIKLKF